MRAILSFAMGAADVGMAASYAYERQWALALTWLCYAIAAVALGTVNQR